MRATCQLLDFYPTYFGCVLLIHVACYGCVLCSIPLLFACLRMRMSSKKTARASVAQLVKTRDVNP